MFTEALTYDDILIRPTYSKVVPSRVEVHTRLTRGIDIAVPLVSAPMDTVTESSLAIAMAQLGGIGMIHRNLSLQEQVREVEIVKRAANGVINDPVTLTPKATLSDAMQMMKHHSVSSFPIVEDNKVIGILTNRDLRFEHDLKKEVSTFMTREIITADEKTSLDEAKKIMNTHKIEKVILVDKDGCLKGLICMRDMLNDINFPLATKDKAGRLRVGAACGVAEHEKKRVHALMKASIDVITVDTAHGHHEDTLRMVRWIKKQYAAMEVIGGNVATGKAAEALVDAGVDAVKVGVGPGSICTTRIISGVGVPQATAIMDVVQVAKTHHIPVIADGGIKYSGDIAKALALGASSVMIGSLFAGTNESPGENIYYKGRTYKSYRGMGSMAAMMRRSHQDRYLQNRQTLDNDKLVPEGVEGGVVLKGDVADVVYQLVGGLKSAMGYCGAETLRDFYEKATFVKITSAGLRESHVHDVIITKEAPNYTQE